MVKQVEAIIKIEAKNKKNKDREIDKKLAKALLSELKAYKKDKINEETYNIIKEDLEWLINN